MKALLTALLSIAAYPLSAQEVRFGFEGGVARNTQLFFNPDRPADGTVQQNWQTGVAANLYARTENVFGPAKRPTGFRTALGFIRKGCSTPYQTSFGNTFPGTAQAIVSSGRAVTTLDYVSAEAMVQQTLFSVGGLSIIADAGLATNVLLHSEIRAGAFEPMADAYFSRTYNDATVSGANVSGILGLEVMSSKGFGLFVRNNRGLTPTFRSEVLRVKDWSWVYGLSVDISKRRFGGGGSGDAAKAL